VTSTTELLDALDLDPGHDPEPSAELVSTLRVYRNAAFVFRQLVDTSGETDPATAALCASTIVQGHDHWRAYMNMTHRGDQADG